MSSTKPIESIFSTDVEDWFHILDIPSLPPLSSWDNLPPRVEGNFLHLLDIFLERKVHVTCFFLGWVGEHYPYLVRRAVRDGHEIASHGYAHRLTYEMGRAAFYEDALRARKVLEDISGEAVVGYRSAGFSARRDTPWFFEMLAEAGYKYDSSVFPAKCGHGGISEYRREPHEVAGNTSSIMEFPITVADFFGKAVCFFGGGYLRLFPYPLIRSMARQVLSEGRPVVFYIHPREIDPHHPRLPMNLKRRFKSYVNLASTEAKLQCILKEFPTTTFRAYMAREAKPTEALLAR